MRVRYNRPKPTARELEQSVARKAKAKAEGRCTHCLGPNDRQGVVSKNGKLAILCSKCLRNQKANVAALREKARAKAGELRRALGLPDEG